MTATKVDFAPAARRTPSRAAAPLHSRIRSDIESRILSGEWPPGHRIPYEHELTAKYGCARMTVSKALTELAKAGLIERRRKAGSFVRRPHSHLAVMEIRDVGQEVAALGLAYAFSLVSRQIRRATRADRARIAAGPGERVLALCCRHDAAGRPFCFEDRLISLAAAPDAADETFEGVSPGAWLMARVPWTIAEHRIRAAAADGNMAASLSVAAGAACLLVERRTWLGEKPVTQVILTYPGDDHELLARFAPTPG